MYDYDYGMTVEDLEFSEDFYSEIDEVIKKEVKGILEENKKLSDENRNVNKKISDARNVLQEEIKQLKGNYLYRLDMGKIEGLKNFQSFSINKKLLFGDNYYFL